MAVKTKAGKKPVRAAQKSAATKPAKGRTTAKANRHTVAVAPVVPNVHEFIFHDIIISYVSPTGEEVDNRNAISRTQDIFVRGQMSPSNSYGTTPPFSAKLRRAGATAVTLPVIKTDSGGWHVQVDTSTLLPTTDYYVTILAPPASDTVPTGQPLVIIKFRTAS